MLNNTTCSTLNVISTPSALNDSQSASRDSIVVAIHVSIVLLAPVAVVGNAVVLTAIWKKSFQRTPFHILLSVLAFSDLCTGVTSLFISIPVLLGLGRLTISYTGILCEIYLAAVTLLVIALLSIERWLTMSRRSLVTSRRGCLIAAASLLVPIPFVVFNTRKLTKGILGREVNTASAAYMLFCYLVTSVAYFKVFRIIRQHQQQIHGNQSCQNVGQPAIDLAKYKKSVVSILYILALFSVSFLPIIFSSFVLVSVGANHKTLTAQHVCFAFLFLSSSVNPGLYILRMADVRCGVKTLFCTNI